MKQLFISRRGFTLIELLISMGIVAGLATVTLLVINPAELIKQGRDGARLSELESLNKAITIFHVDKSSAGLGIPYTAYTSLVDTSVANLPTNDPTQCDGLIASGQLPKLPPPWSYHCVTDPAQLRNIDGNGWLPLDFSKLSTQLFDVLLIDPINDPSQGLYFIYAFGATDYSIASTLESIKYLHQNALSDQGTDPARVEMGETEMWTDASGLTGFWKFEDPQGLAATDSSGNNHTGAAH